MIKIRLKEWVRWSGTGMGTVHFSCSGTSVARMLSRDPSLAFSRYLSVTIAFLYCYYRYPLPTTSVCFWQALHRFLSRHSCCVVMIAQFTIWSKIHPVWSKVSVRFFCCISLFHLLASDKTSMVFLPNAILSLYSKLIHSSVFSLRTYDGWYM